mmetsp:Transcript_9406/g.26391  ORF Transcript_9406/g.26391 Transcript_9406/m.26391 type:complete len:626 (-) Transcript_9406:70-1947(-)|eukprot:CAMPEP_0119121550 /NCGR_PEP_ID=MMETSP1310-20130426/2130_1 /TAXON_ID=464262 /ORGANISM="Genus nov. species nov., Strain RCC2339" /LENGTH=625 /DNA_ID=CAMNT_0007111121 /DNA_START=51 /DNA_END=1928 /DNA_ORIENTATION=-
MSIVTESYNKGKSVATFGIADQDRLDGTQVDEEQQKHYEEIIELLVAAGYFRARIKGLRPFDKVIGGLIWSIMNSAVDLDVDIFFEEGAKLGQEIKLGEDIIRALRRMKCPYPLQSNQIRGLDCINIFPVVQWLVKKVLETREEMGDLLRTFSVYQFHQRDELPDDQAARERQAVAVAFLEDVGEKYHPERGFRAKYEPEEEEERVQQTLLEYGDRSVSIDLRMAGQKQKRKGGAGSSFNVAAALESKEGGKDDLSAKLKEEQEKQIQSLMEGMTSVSGDASRVSGSKVGDILNFQSSELLQIVEMHAEEHEKIKAKLEEVMAADDYAELQHHRQLQKREQKIASVLEEMSGLEEEHAQVRETYDELSAQLNKQLALNQRIEEEIARLEALETPENADDLKRLKQLVALNESLKVQEKEFRASCVKERKRLQDLIDNDHISTEDEEELQRIEMIETTYEDDKARLTQLKSMVAKKTRDIAMVKRRIDEIPSRAELTQYQQALLDLYEQVDSKLNETRQYYATYNTLMNTLEFWQSEVKLMESISMTYKSAMKSQSAREAFLKQLQEKLDIVEGNIQKASAKLASEQQSLEEVKAKYTALVDKERTYFKATKEFQEECALNEKLRG